MCPSLAVGLLTPPMYSGIGFAICQRLLLQLSVPNPPDALPEPLVDPSYSLAPTSSLESTPFDALTIILACRNKSRGLEARDKLFTFIDTELLKRRLQNRAGKRSDDAESEKLAAYADEFRRNLILDFVPCDLASVTSVLEFSDTIQNK